MDNSKLLDLLQSVASGGTTVHQAAAHLKHLVVEDIEYAHIDHHRSLRKGFPEVIFGEGKTSEQIIGIIEKIVQQESIVLVTRLSPEKAESVQQHYPDTTYHSDARMLVWEIKKIDTPHRGTILVVSAGTSDIPVAKEAALTAAAMGNPVKTIYDVGVAGIHRLLAYKALLEEATVIIVVAGMEGALPSVVGGLVQSPIIAVPTSIGYGTNMGGLTALFAMLNSCSSNIAVVNIDNGFGAGYMAATINRVFPQ